MSEHEPGYEKVTYCKDCRFAYCPVAMDSHGNPVVLTRFCDRTRRLVKDNGFCDMGVKRDG